MRAYQGGDKGYDKNKGYLQSLLVEGEKKEKGRQDGVWCALCVGGGGFMNRNARFTFPQKPE